MIKEIQIENFKSIQSLNLELGRLNVFIGANGSGKSNILEAIAFGSAAIHDKLDSEFLYARGVRKTDTRLIKSGFDNSHSSKSIDINLKFENEDYYYPIKLDFDGGDTSSKLKRIGGFVVKFNVLLKELSYLIEKGIFNGEDDAKPALKYLEQQKAIESNINDFLIFAPENYFLRRFEEDSQIEPLGIRGEGLFSQLVKISKEKPELFNKINEYLDLLLDWFGGFEIPKDLMFTERRIKIKDRNLEEGLQYIDQRSANEGFLYLLFYFTLFISKETPRFFAIDNIDNAMNPKLGRKLIKVLSKLAKEHDKQAILTTHNPAILDGLNLNNAELDQRLFVVYRDADGATSVRRIMPKQVENGVTPVPLSEQFLRGYLGGLPDNF